MPAELRKRAAPAQPAPPPKAKKAARSKAKGKKDDVPKQDKPSASNLAEDPSGEIAEGAGGVSAAAEVTSADVAKEVAEKVQAAAVKNKRGAKATKAEEQAEAPTTGGSVELDGFGGDNRHERWRKNNACKVGRKQQSRCRALYLPEGLYARLYVNKSRSTKQACLFRDAYDPLTATGLSIYGLSTDSPKANTTFKTKQELPYPLLCDPSAILISANGFKSGKSTTRGVFVVDKSGKVLVVEAGRPQPTVDAVKKVVKELGGDSNAEGIKKAEDTAMKSSESAADTVPEVTDTAEMIDA
ncbi:thioredoxin peroxidase dot5 [Elasticomyces elasticus]|nr:thioredoxin peroxidase dot5 [Elasticomyces elasticus]